MISRICLARNAAASPRFWRGLGDPYRMHTELWRFFGDNPDRQRDFLYRVDVQQGRPEIYTVSKREPEPKSGIWEVACKPYAPRIHEGQRLAFMVRVNPVVTRRDAAGKQHRHDVVMDAKTRIQSAGAPPKGTQELVQQEGTAWLTARGPKHGYDLIPGTVAADSYQQLRLWKPNARMNVNLSTLDLQGVLTVTDPAAFTAMLTQGLGPAKGFGCGLMLVRPAP